MLFRSRPGDEQWYKLEQALADIGLGRKAGETVRQWLLRIEGGKWKDLASLYDIQHYAVQELDALQQQAYVCCMQEIDNYCAEYKRRG